MFNLTNQVEMTPEERITAWNKFYLHVTKGNKDAAEYLVNFNYIAHLWDDLIDKDKVRTDDEISRAFFLLMVKIPRNAFYRQYSSILVDYSQVYINQWFTANHLEKQGERGLERAFALRDVTSDMICQVAYILGGYSWMKKINEDLIPILLAYESFAEYSQEIKK